MIAAIGGLSACGGSNALSYDGMADKAAQLRDELAEEAPTEVMPTSGNATYNGIAELDSEFGNVYAEVKMNASFAADGGQISGEMTNFRTDEDKASGSVEIEEASFGPSGEFSNNLSGTLTSGGEGGEVSGSLDGRFLGENAKGVAGTVDLSVDGSALSGVFGAIKR